MDEDVNKVNKLFVGGLNLITSKGKLDNIIYLDSLKNYFSKFGEITESLIMFDRISSKRIILNFR